MIFLINCFSFLRCLFNKSLRNYKNEKLICSEMIAIPISRVLNYDFGLSFDLIGMDEIEACLKKVGSLEWSKEK
jgi:hypothetical protein